MSLASMFVNSTKNNTSSRIVFYDCGRDMKYDSFYNLCLSFADGISRNSEENGVVLIQLADPFDTLRAFWGCILSGNIPALYPIGKNIKKHVEQLGALCKKYEIKRIVSDRNFCKIISDNIKDVQVILTDEITSDELSAESIKKIENNLKPLSRGDDVIMLQFSSGSTGAPKGVMLSNDNVTEDVDAIVERTTLEEKDKLLNWLPLSHDFGIIAMHMSPIRTKSDQVVLSPVTFLRNPYIWAKLATEYQITMSALPDFAMKLLLKTYDREKYLSADLSHLRLVATAGEGISSKACLGFYNTFKNHNLRDNAITPAYGLAEGTAAATIIKHGDPILLCSVNTNASIGEKIELTDSLKGGRQLVGCGPAIGCNSVTVCDDDGNELSELTLGNVIVSGKNVTQGYYMNSAATDEIIKNGKLITGDIGFMYKGELFITGRRKEMIILNGKNYFSADIEQTIRENVSLPGTAAIAAFKVYDNSLEKELLYIAVEKGESEPDTEKISALIKDTALKQMQITVSEVVFEEELPKTASGKIKYYALSQKYESTAKSGGVNKEIIALLEEELESGLSKDDYDTPFSQLGIDSIKIENIFRKLEETFNIKITMDVLWNYPTIRELSAYIAENGYDNKAVEITDTPSDAALKSDDIAVVSMACHFPGDADTPEKFWNNLVNGVNSIGKPDNERCNSLSAVSRERLAGYVKNVFDIDTKLFGISPNEASKIDPQQRLLLKTAEELIANAGLSRDAISNSDTGVFVGISNHDYGLIISKTDSAADVYASIGNSACIASNRISYTYNLHGPSVSVDTACSSSLVAIHAAAKALREGECSAAICGGVNVLLDENISRAFEDAGMLSPDGKCKTFDKSADGYVRGEGCGLVLLKTLTRAKKDNDTIYAIIKGSAVNQDGKSNGITAPNGKAQELVIKKALENAKTGFSEIDYIETHGTGTKLGDPIEVNTLNKLFDNPRENDVCYLGSVKPNIGHLEAAAGVASFIKAVLILNKNQIPPTINFGELNPYITLNENAIKIADISNLSENRKREINNIGISSFGFGGTNCHMVIGKYQNGASVERLNAVCSTSAVISPVVSGNSNREEDNIMDSSVISELKLHTELLKSQLELLKRLDLFEAPKATDNGGAPQTQDTDFRQYILQVLSDVTAYPISSIALNDTLRNDLGFDSLMTGKLIERISTDCPIDDAGIQKIVAESQSDDFTVSDLMRAAQSEIGTSYTLPEPITPAPSAAYDTSEKPVAAQISVLDFDEYKDIRERLNAEKQNPYYKVSYGMPLDTIKTDDGIKINYSTYNYVGLNGNPKIAEESINAIKKYGTSVSGSRMISGEILLHRELENEITSFLGTEDTIAYIGGYTTNVSAISTVVSHQDLILHDALSHNSIITGAILSGAKRMSFKHNDMNSLEEALKRTRNYYRRILIIAEGVYSMDGDICNLREMIELKKKYGAFLMIDEAHSLGTIGDCGRGVGSYYGVDRGDVDLWMGTMSKSLASCGGYISGKKELIELLKYTSNGFMFSVGLPPSNAAAALAAIKTLRTSPELVENLKENCDYFLKLMKEHNLDTGLAMGTAVIPCILKDSRKCMLVSKKLYEKGINVMPIVYPAVPDNESRLRFFISTLHTKEQMKYTVDILSRILDEIN